MLSAGRALLLRVPRKLPWRASAPPAACAVSRGSAAESMSVRYGYRKGARDAIRSFLRRARGISRGRHCCEPARRRPLALAMGARRTRNQCCSAWPTCLFWAYSCALHAGLQRSSAPSSLFAWQCFVKLWLSKPFFWIPSADCRLHPRADLQAQHPAFS
eukprot:07100_3